jgi:hypothetical protein
VQVCRNQESFPNKTHPGDREGESRKGVLRAMTVVRHKVEKVMRRLTEQEKAAALLLYDSSLGISKEEFQKRMDDVVVETYPTAQENPNCCIHQNPMGPMFCMEGHLLECHQGMDCEEAQCNHYKQEAIDP